MIIKTRERLIDVARQLFVRNGVENTTMNDIAAASEKGRRTIYTYFKNKREIYNAVIERESEQLLSQLRDVASSSRPPLEKLEEYLTMRFNLMTEMLSKRDSLRYRIIKEFRKVERVRRMTLVKEREIFQALLRDGVDAGAFDPNQANRLSELSSLALLDIDFYHSPEVIEESGIDIETVRDHIVKYVINGIIAHS